MGNGGEKPEKLEELARREADEERQRAESAKRRVADAERLAREVPARFLQLAAEVRSAVERFNGAADPQKRLTLQESSALAARDPNPNADFNLTVGRAGAEVVLSLNAFGRSGRPDVFLIEANGRLRDDAFLLRAEGAVQEGKTRYRISIDFRRMEWPIEELAERLVRAVVKADRGVLA